MSDSYQAIYDAVRSRISNGDVGRAVSEAAFRQFDISHYMARLNEQFMIAAYEMQRPSAIFKPRLSADGTMWCALLGDNLQEGIAGFGATPNEAMEAFDRAFRNERTPKAIRMEKADVA